MNAWLSCFGFSFGITGWIWAMFANHRVGVLERELRK